MLFSGWTPIILAMVISSLAGIILESNVEEYKGVALLTPVLIGLAGNFGSIYVSRISTALHSKTTENYGSVELTLWTMNIPVQLVFMLVIWAFNLGQLSYNAWFFIDYLLVSVICVS
jgi:solute carrier family 41